MGYYTKKVPYKIASTLNTLKGTPIDCFQEDSSIMLEGADKIKQDLSCLLELYQGEIFFEPEVGSNLEDILFENNDFVLVDLIRYKIEDCVKKFIPQISVKDVQVDQHFDENYIGINIKYYINSLGKDDTVYLYKDIKESFGGVEE